MLPGIAGIAGFASTTAGGGGIPPGLPVPYAWFDANQQSGADLSAIATLVDQSGNGRDFTQATSANQPLLRHSDLNGLKTIQIGEDSGGSRALTYMETASSFLSGASAAHMFYVMRAANSPAQDSDNGAVFSQMDDFGNTTHCPDDAGNIQSGFCSSARRASIPPWELHNWLIYEEWSAANDWGVKINGHDVNSSGTNTVALASQVRRFGIGSTPGNTTNRFRGRFAQGWFFDSKLSSGDAELVREYLAETLGLTPVLPLGHAGKTYPSATHWRIRCRDSDGANNSFGMRELEMYASTDGTGANLADISGSNDAIASHNDGSFPKENAFNGNTSDFWTSLGTAPPSGGHWIGVQFASAVSIGSFRVNTRGDFNETPTLYTLDYSLDGGTTWLTMMAGGAITGNSWVVLPT